MSDNEILSGRNRIPYFIGAFPGRDAIRKTLFLPTGRRHHRHNRSRGETPRTTQAKSAGADRCPHNARYVISQTGLPPPDLLKRRCPGGRTGCNEGATNALAERRVWMILEDVFPS